MKPKRYGKQHTIKTSNSPLKPKVKRGESVSAFGKRICEVAYQYTSKAHNVMPNDFNEDQELRQNRRNNF
uniref:Uncharacterized protein n=1 Tax=Megaselia scalaris TaxID=36166 RepID=T1GZD6_MEGSC